MLYQWQEAQRAFLQPLSDWALSASQMYANPYSPFSYIPGAARVSAGLELMHRLGKDYEKPLFSIKNVMIDGEEVPIIERCVLNKPFCKLIRFERLLPKSLAHREKDPSVLMFAPLSGHHATLLRDTVRTMLPDHNVYITDWVDARMVPLSEGDFHLNDYVHYCIEFFRLLGPEVHSMSVCQPTVPVMAAISLMCSLKDNARPLSMTMMGGPIDARRSPTTVNQYATDRPFAWFENNVIFRVPGRYPGAGRMVYPGFLQHAGFIAMNPDRHATSHWDFYQSLVRGDMQDAEQHRRFYDEYNAVLDMPAEYYLDTIHTVFQKHMLPNGTWDVDVDGEVLRVDPKAIRDVPLFTIEGELDDISGSGQTEAAHGLTPNLPAAHKQHHVAMGAGHYGIFSGRRWRDLIYPRVRDFIATHPRRIKSR
ncbi:MAG: polyhydroxyalkanoate depolymerase [Betaproteobacteria bacterium]|jgi:poly(3-hydroxybutyrate) depolymerase|nr:polyhydroxyalkanoate depolymerase [Betaproteobacteria bacterium]HAB47288.1 polyhydroxyalkanoate depolymerase [Lautropia sp.]NBO94533.1 polyhydroxyalkanoate depolymerase [Betaproteobacteria bacterium]NBP34678.1 polyhydroxyalkanoate depolymerase [Betaproteobacteria bacterium]NBQ78517.1 polyhydroxyalkanoate depolymerase [Betaproteobacteria bacterium]